MVRVLLISALLASACSKDPASAAAEKANAAMNARDTVIAAWKSSGLTGTFAAAPIAIGKDCQTGAINGIDVAICMYASPDEAKQAEAAGLDWVGDTTGTALARGALLVAIADRKKSDREGKTINQLMKLVPMPAAPAK